jgi:hypothetical protein
MRMEICSGLFEVVVGNFGIVTSLEYQLHPTGNILGGILTYPISALREVLTFLDGFMLNGTGRVRRCSRYRQRRPYDFRTGSHRVCLESRGELPWRSWSRRNGAEALTFIPPAISRYYSGHALPCSPDSKRHPPIG